MLKRAETAADCPKPRTEFHDEVPFVIPTREETHRFLLRISERPIYITLPDKRIVKIFFSRERARVCMIISQLFCQNPAIFDLPLGEHIIDPERKVTVKIHGQNTEGRIIAEIENQGLPLLYGVAAIATTIKESVEKATIIAKELDTGESCIVRWGGTPILVMTRLGGVIGGIIQEGQNLYLFNRNSLQRIALHEGIQFIGREYQNDGFFGAGQEQYFVADKHLSIHIQRHPNDFIYIRFQVLDAKSGARIIVGKM